jgi:hypothetical protein
VNKENDHHDEKRPAAALSSLAMSNAECTVGRPKDEHPPATKAKIKRLLLLMGGPSNRISRKAEPESNIFRNFGKWRERLGRKKSQLSFCTAAQIAAECPEAVEWIARPWVAKGAIAEVNGQVKAAGKTTWIMNLCGSVIQGNNFMGQPTSKTPVVYLTEQPMASFKVALDRAGLSEREDMRVLFWNRSLRATWPETVTQSIAMCNKIGARLLVVDTIAQFAGLVGGTENQAGDALKAMQPLICAAEQGLGIVVVRHERKKGGEVGSSGRGSSAFSGVADIVLSIRRPEGRNRPTVRVIHSLSRFSETPDICVVELTDAGYVALGEQEDATKQQTKAGIVEALPLSEADALPLEELSTRTGIGRTSAQRAIDELLAENKIGRTGQGRRNDPVRYFARTE